MKTKACCFCGRKYGPQELMTHNVTKKTLCIDCITGTNRDLIAMMAKALAGVGINDKP